VEFPNVVAWAVPFFLLLLGLEYRSRRRFGLRFEARDTWASLAMGSGNFLIGLALAGAYAAAFAAVHSVRLFDLGYTPAVFVACFFAEDLAYYWFHRLSHESRWLWASHVIHHSSRYYNLSTALRQTWTSKITFAWVFWLPLAWVGFPPPMIFLFTGISLVYQFWIHTESIRRLGPLEWVMNTPSHHRVHHATNPRYLDANYAGVLIVWDRLFGSFVPESEADPPRYGIVKNLATYNPLRIAFHEWAAIARDVLSDASPADALRHLFGPPGWSRDGSRATSAIIKERWRRAGEPAGVEAWRFAHPEGAPGVEVGSGPTPEAAR
jgi:sterol desaturase/sphingolipid hydroxylase (fatty acid hydroxylase superfamily)